MRRVAAAAFIALAALSVLPAASAQQTPNTTAQWYGNAPFPEAYQSVNAVGSGSFVLTSQPGTSSNLMVTYGAASGTQQLSQGLPPSNDGQSIVSTSAKYVGYLSTGYDVMLANPSGSGYWIWQPPYGYIGYAYALAIGDESSFSGVTVAAVFDQGIYVIRNGNLVTNFTSSLDTSGSIAIAGGVLAGLDSDSGNVVGVDPDSGSTLWSVPVGDGYVTVSAFNGGFLVVTTNSVMSLDTSGNTVYTVNPSGAVFGAAGGPDGNVYVVLGSYSAERVLDRVRGITDRRERRAATRKVLQSMGGGSTLSMYSGSEVTQWSVSLDVNYASTVAVDAADGSIVVACGSNACSQVYSSSGSPINAFPASEMPVAPVAAVNGYVLAYGSSNAEEFTVWATAYAQNSGVAKGAALRRVKPQLPKRKP